MRYQYKFEKILTIKEKEKNDAFTKYNESRKSFEEVAEKLYKLLKKKEDLEAFQKEKLVSGLSVQEIRHHQQFMENLDRIIDHYQKAVIEARSKMEFLHSKLLEHNMEVKKYEKIKEKDFQRFLDGIREDDNRNMDEISIQQFLGRENR
ncbi:flagellar biosynthesis chaperone FliJ [Peribacillus saganii]|uniref:Flagellar FliJ protein n=1 Tax=Peribacillus saganii TaxID=2303992 RepID=A0A372LTR4_9BACI|nr:flagellar export protein FliJ [Peribacillus saganii]RFU71287.1 flagellar biosynthesis chaperone FliJ [Peribacillus saganii]